VSDEEPHLSCEQAAALAPEIRLIEAGPGAGKTRTVVARFKRNASAGRAAALLSFTNAAVDVARSRCRAEPALLDAPNFVGTFDQFFHRYVVTPDACRRAGTVPRYVSSWDNLPDHLARVRPPNGGVGVRLSIFTPGLGGWSLDPERLNRTERQAWDKLSDWSQKQIVEKASKRIAGLHSNHVFDTTESRHQALQALDADHAFLPRLSRRFTEIIVDEFQDCDAVEYQILHRLHKAGIHIVTVADPDQAIYEFRQHTNGLYERRREQLDKQHIAQLTTCYRSSEAICQLTTSLRSVGLSAIAPDADHQGGAESIHVVVGTGVKAGAAAIAIVREHRVAPEQTRIIAHRRSDARALASAGNQPPDGNSWMQGLLVALADLHGRADARVRLRAVRRIEGFVLNQFEWPTNSAIDTKEQQLELLKVDAEHLRVLVGKFLIASREWSDAKCCSKSVRGLLEAFSAGLPVSLLSALGRRLVVRSKVWSFWESRTMAATTKDNPVRWVHVHAVKGDEFDGVVLAIPATKTAPTHPLDDWENGLNTEQRRVLYVGASRAAKVLVIVVPKAKSAQLVNILTASKVPHTVTAVK
jgi:DNA helicase-2/ATP-dependent DNA helicase PcrA